MIQSLYYAIEHSMNDRSTIGVLEGLLSNKDAVFNREFARSFPLAFTHFRLADVEKGNWHDGCQQDRWITLPEAYALTNEDVVKVNFQWDGRLFIPVRTYAIAYPFAISPIFGLGYTLEEVESDKPDIGLKIKSINPINTYRKEYEWQGEPAIEFSLDLRNGYHFWNDKKKGRELPHTFLAITTSAFSEKFLHKQRGGHDAEELFYQTLKGEYKEYLSELLDREKKKKVDLAGKLERIED